MTKIVKRLVSAVLSLLLAASVFSTALALDFSDVSGDLKEIVSYWSDKGVISGYTDGTFRPDNPITRAEIASIFYKALELDPGTGKHFSDVKSTSWSFNAVEACVKSRLIYGYGDGSFHPSAQITRQELVTIVSRAVRYTVQDVDSLLERVSDRDSISAYAREPFAILLGAGVLDTEGGKLRPRDYATRSEVVSMLYNIDVDNGWKRVLLGVNTASVTWTSEKDDGASARSIEIDGDYWLLLPAGADLTAVSISLNEVKENVSIQVIGDKGSSFQMPFDLTEVASREEDGSYSLNVTVNTFGEVAGDMLKIMASDSVSALFVTSNDPENEGREHVDAVKGNSAKGSLVMLSPEGDVLYSGALSQVKSRGNSTFYYNKKSYQIKLDKKTDLLRNGEKVKTWVLLAQFGDPTMFRDKLCKDIASDFGIDGSPDSDWVDLFYDGEYRGTYQLSEKVQVSSTGLDITDLESLYEELNEGYGKDPELKVGYNSYGNEVHYVDGLVDPENMTTGFVLEENFRSGDENSWFKTTDGRAYNIKYPENVSLEAGIYISELMQELEDAVKTVDRYGKLTGINTSTGRSYDEIADVQSLARMYLLYYWSNNQDAYCQSTFYYTVDGKLYAGPMWDSDQTFGLGWSVFDLPTDTPLHFDHIIKELTQIPSFQRVVKEIYESEFRPLAERYAKEVTKEYEAEISGTERMNHLIWPKYYQNAGLYSSYPRSVTYSDLRDNVEKWMLGRLDHMDELMANW